MRGAETFSEVTGIPAPNRGDDYVADVVIDQVFAEIWTRPGLTRKERRWISITCACMTGAPVAMEAHLGAALRSGDISMEELREFVTSPPMRDILKRPLHVPPSTPRALG
jgi:4-carboxymuconolactone decarboxylase